MTIHAAKEEIHNAIWALRRAVSLLDRAEYKETADELAREITLIKVQLTVIEAVETGEPWPEDVEFVGARMLRQAQGVERDGE